MMAGSAVSSVGRLGGQVGERWYLRALVGAALVTLILVLVIVWVDYAGTRTDERVALTFLINLVAVIGFQIFMGNSGVPTFGHVGFVAIGAYTTAIVMTPVERKASDTLIPDAPGFILNTEVGFYPALAIAIGVVTIVAFLSGTTIVRLRGGSAAIATLALLIIIRTVIGNLEDITRGPKTWSGIPEYTTIWVALGLAVVAIFVARLFRESSPGLRLRATRSDELAAGAVGVDIARDRLLAWMLSAAVAGAAGALWATYFLSLAPQDFFFDLTFLYIVMVIIGGPSVSGAVAGAGAVTLITEFLRRTETSGIHIGPIDADQVFGLTPLVLGLLILLTVILRPEGILGRWELDERLGRAARWLRMRRQGNLDAAPVAAGTPQAPRTVEQEKGASTAPSDDVPDRRAGETGETNPYPEGKT